MNVPSLTINSNTGTVNTNIIGQSQPDPFAGSSSPNGYIYPNSNLIKLSARKVSFQLTTLGQTTHTYTSPSYNDITLLAQYFVDWGCSYEIIEGPVHTITVTCPWDTMTAEDFNISLFDSTQWEITPTVDTKDLIINGLLSNPFVVPTVTNGIYTVLPIAVQLGVQRALENKTNINLSGSMFSNYQNVATRILEYKRRGVEGVPSYGQTLKRTAVIDSRNSNHAFQSVADASCNSINAQGTINYILSTEGLAYSDYQIPYVVQSFLLPSYRKSITVNGVDNYSASVYAGWLIKPPTFQFITRNKVQLSQEFVWNEWLEGLYYIASPSSSFPLVQVPSGSAF